MRRSLPFVLLVLLCSSLVLPSPLAGAEDDGPPALTGRLSVEDGMKVLTLWGTPKERGFAHGWLLAREIVAGLDSGLRDAFGGRLDGYERVLKPMAVAAFAWAPKETSELEGLLAGVVARLPNDKERTLEAVGRPLTLDDLKVLNVFGDTYPLACTSLAVWGARTADGTPSVVRNFDFPALDLVLADQHIRVVRPPPGDETGLGWVGIAHPGGIGAMTVMNEQGVFAAIHDVHVVPEAKDLGQGNVPRLVAIRRLAEGVRAKGAVEEAAKRCRSWNTLYGNNFLVATPEAGDGRPAGVLEYDTRETANRGVDIRGSRTTEENADGFFVACTNHHRIRGEGSCGRFDRVTGACQEEPQGVLGVDALFAIANRASVPAAGESVRRGGLGTLHQVVAETGAKRLHVRFTKRGGNIRDARTQVLDVGALLDEAGRAEAAR